MDDDRIRSTESARLSWQSENAVKAGLTNSRVYGYEPVNTSGSRLVSPDDDTRYTVQVENDAETPASDSVAIDVKRVLHETTMLPLTHEDSETYGEDTDTPWFEHTYRDDQPARFLTQYGIPNQHPTVKGVRNAFNRTVTVTHEGATGGVTLRPGQLTTAFNGMPFTGWWQVRYEASTGEEGISSVHDRPTTLPLDVTWHWEERGY